jgi:exodeoxyribonuclease VII small subunit
MTEGSHSSSTAREPTVVPVAELSYTDASRELDEIVAFFEQREVDVDLLVARLERATSIVDELDRRLRRTRAQVEQLVPKLEAAADPDREDEVEDSEDPDSRSGRPRSSTASGRGNEAPGLF